MSPSWSDGIFSQFLSFIGTSFILLTQLRSDHSQCNYNLNLVRTYSIPWVGALGRGPGSGPTGSEMSCCNILLIRDFLHSLLVRFFVLISTHTHTHWLCHIMDTVNTKLLSWSRDAQIQSAMAGLLRGFVSYQAEAKVGRASSTCRIENTAGIRSSLTRFAHLGVPVWFILVTLVCLLACSGVSQTNQQTAQSDQSADSTVGSISRQHSMLCASF